VPLSDQEPLSARRVLLVNSSLALGGLERQLILLARHLPKEWTPLVWVVDGGPYEQMCREQAVPLVVAGRTSRWDLRPALSLWRVIREWRPDVIHSWHWMSMAAALPAALRFRIPVVDGSIRRGDRPSERLRPHRALMRFARIVVANSHAGLHAWGVSGSKGRVIYNAFDPGRLRRPHIPSPGPFTVAMCARMDGSKDFDTVLEAARKLVSSHSDGAHTPEWRFLLVGDGPDRIRLSRVADTLIAAGTVEMLSPGLEVMDVLAGADVGVLMTDPVALAEGCSNALLEYMACGLPVVCSESGGNSEVVLDNTTGFIVPPQDSDALVEKLRLLRGDRDERRRLGDAGRRRVADEFSVDRMVTSYVALYESLLRAR
jgi:glycosyltransferase involved in cell wall biosynthesis